MKKIFFFILTCICCACSSSTLSEGGDLQYAQWLKLEEGDKYTLATVLNPWKEGEILHRYALVEEGGSAPDSLQATEIHIPLQQAVTATSVHSFLVYRLKAVHQLAGVMDKRFIVSKKLLEAIDSLADFGNSQNPDIEAIATHHCDAVFVSPFENANYGKLENLHIPLIECADYMETSPLGRAEWMRFYGRLFGKGEEADSIFHYEEMQYNEICKECAKSTAKPMLMMDVQQGSAWYVPGGKSYLAQLFKDANVQYFFADDTSYGSVPLSFEQVYAQAAQADIWLMRTSTNMTYKTLETDNPRYTAFRPFKEKNIWYCNTLTTPYYDVTPFAPSVLLRELFFIAHPDSTLKYKSQYFVPVLP